MAIQVNLASGGVMGVTGLSAGEHATGDGTLNMDPDNVYAVTGSDSIDLRLPSPGTSEDWEGRVIVIKLLTTEAGSPLAFPTITVTRENDIHIDAQDSDMIISDAASTNQTISFYFVNFDSDGAHVGWLAGPSVL